MAGVIDIDGEDLSMELLPELERAFGVTFDQDLSHLVTAGDLFREVLKGRPPIGLGDRHDTSMAFHALRRALAPLWDNDKPSPSTPLRGNELPFPRKLAPLLAAKTGYDMPARTLSMVVMLGIAALGAGALFALFVDKPIVVAVLGVLAIVLVKFDPGEFSGDWETLGSLTRAVNNLNFVTLVEAGARDTEETNWRAFAELLANYAFVGKRQADPREIGPETVLRMR